MTESPRPPDDRGGLVPARPSGLARLAISALRRPRPTIGILGARDDEKAELFRVLDDLGGDGVHLAPSTEPASALDRRSIDLFVALHAEARRAATGAPLPSYAPVVCVLKLAEGETWDGGPGLPVRAPFAPILPLTLDRSFDDLRAIVTDGLVLRRYMRDHPDDDAPIGRPFHRDRGDDRLDLLHIPGEGGGVAAVEGTLRHAGFVGTVRRYFRVADAFEAFDERRPDLLWTSQRIGDWSLMDGIEMLRLLRPRTRHAIPTLLESESLTEWQRASAYSTGAGAGAFLCVGQDQRDAQVVLRNAARMRRALRHAGAP